MRGVLVAAALACFGVATAGEARENRPLKCSIGKARAAPSPGGPAMVANVPRAMTPIDLNAVQMTDKGVWKKVIVEGLFAHRTPANTLEVLARLVNCTKDPLVIQARASFMDQSQYPTEPPSTWRSVHIPPLSMASFEERSVGTANVGLFLVELRSDQ